MKGMVLKEKKTTHLQKLIEVTTPSQMGCIALTCILLAYTPQLIQKTYTYTRFRKLERPDYTTEELSDFWMVVPCVIVARLLKIIINSLTSGFFQEKLKAKYSGQDLEAKVNKCCKGVFKVIWFTFTFFFGLTQVLWKCDFASPLMMGNGDNALLIGNWPYTQMPPYMKFHYMLSLSYYVEDGLMLCFQMPNFDFWEMIMHHVVTGLLIFSSYMSGFWIFGILILVQMDIADVFVGLVRTFMDFCKIQYAVMIYLGIMTSWFYMRFVCYIKLIIYDFTLDARLAIDGVHDSVVVINFLLFALLLLNVYWFILLVRMGLRLAIYGKAKDLQQVTSKAEDEQN